MSDIGCAYLPPTENLALFNPDVFPQFANSSDSTSTALTDEQLKDLNMYFVTYPSAQGQITFPSLICEETLFVSDITCNNNFSATSGTCTVSEIIFSRDGSTLTTATGTTGGGLTKTQADGYYVEKTTTDGTSSATINELNSNTITFGKTGQQIKASGSGAAGIVNINTLAVTNLACGQLQSESFQSNSYLFPSHNNSFVEGASKESSTTAIITQNLQVNKLIFSDGTSMTTKATGGTTTGNSFSVVFYNS